MACPLPLVPPRGNFRVLLIFLDCLFIFLTAGVIFGFVPLKKILVDAGVYQWLCDDIPSTGIPEGEDTYCKAQSLRFTIMYTVAAFALNAICLPAGIFVKSWGPAVTSFFCEASVFLGFVLMGYGSEDFDSFIPAFILIGAGGGAFFSTQLHLSNLYKNREGLIASFFASLFNGSAAVFLFLWYFYDNTKFGLKDVFCGYAAVPVVLIVLYLLFFPYELTPVASEAPLEEKPILNPSIGSADVQHIWSDSVESSEFLNIEKFEYRKGRQYNRRGQPLKQQLLSLDLLLFAVFLAWSCTIFNFYIAEVDNLMDIVAKNQGEKDADLYTTIFSWMLPFSAPIAVPFCGFLIDFFGYFRGLFLLGFLAILPMALFFVPILQIQPIAFLSVVLGLTLMFSLGPSFISFFVGIKNYGTIWGSICVLIGLFSFFILLFSWIAQKVFTHSKTGFSVVLLIMIGLEVVLFIVPWFFLGKNRVYRQNEQDEGESFFEQQFFEDKEPQTFLEAGKAKGDLLIQQ